MSLLWVVVGVVLLANVLVIPALLLGRWWLTRRPARPRVVLPPFPQVPCQQVRPAELKTPGPVTARRTRDAAHHH